MPVWEHPAARRVRSGVRSGVYTAVMGPLEAELARLGMVNQRLRARAELPWPLRWGLVVAALAALTLAPWRDRGAHDSRGVLLAGALALVMLLAWTRLSPVQRLVGLTLFALAGLAELGRVATGAILGLLLVARWWLPPAPAPPAPDEGVAADERIPAGLRELAARRGLPDEDVRMLAGISYRGEAPRTAERWQHIYDAIRASRSLDEEP